jgi:hypothetical protein
MKTGESKEFSPEKSLLRCWRKLASFGDGTTGRRERT